MPTLKACIHPSNKKLATSIKYKFAARLAQMGKIVHNLASSLSTPLRAVPGAKTEIST